MWTGSLTAWFLLAALNAAASSLVNTTHGPIEGTTLTLFNGKTVEEYLGVPYAAPPIGQNRFSPPQPLAPWTDTRSAKKLPMTCPQGVTERQRKTTWYVSNLTEDEDCLYVNFWRPQGLDKMPIMIWIHGGGYMSGSSSMQLYNASILASENQVVVASINYRLTMFGFLYLNNSDVPGNAGLQDQIQAIRWIRENAVAFGGDPERITLFGQSAGAISINAFMVNKEVRPLFRYAIMQSATLNSPVITLSPSEAYEVSCTLAERVQCPTEDKQEMATCLRSKNASVLQGTIRETFINGHNVYGPIRNGIEIPRDVSNVAQLVPDHDRKNVLIGNIPSEFAFITDLFYPDKNLTDDLTVTLEEMSNTIKSLYQLRDDRLVDVFIHEYKNFHGDYNSSNVRSEIMEAISDSMILCPNLNFTLEWMSKSNRMYYYYFTHRPSRPLKYYVPEWIGPIHGDEIPFVLGTPLNPEKGYSNEDKKLTKIIMKYWDNFVRTGNPNGNSSDLKGIYWPPLTPGGNFTHLEFEQTKIEKKSFLAERRCEFFSQIYPKLLSIQQQLDTT